MSAASDAPAPAPAETTPPSKAEPAMDMVSGFLPKEFFGEKPPKVGETCEVTVKAVDPESGEVEVTYNQHEEGEKESGGAMAALDDEFPESPEGEQ